MTKQTSLKDTSVKQSRLKKLNNSIEKYPNTKRLTPYQGLKGMMSWSKHNTSPKLLKAVAKDLLEWAEKDDSMDLIKFLLMYGVSRRVFLDMCYRSDELGAAHELTMEILGARRAHKLEAHDASQIARTLHMYHPVWAESVQQERSFKKALKNAEQENRPTHITVEMTDYGKDDS